MTKQTTIPTPCRAACKNEAGICSGCHRTMDELAEWRQMDDDKRTSKMEQLTGTLSTHGCPNCGESAFCDISAGKDTCWCFELEKRDRSSLDKTAGCLCRKCLAALPVE